MIVCCIWIINFVDRGYRSFFNFAGKLQILICSFKMKVRCDTRNCLPSKTAQEGNLQGPAGFLGLNSLMISKQSFCETAQKQKGALTVVI